MNNPTDNKPGLVEPIATKLADSIEAARVFRGEAIELPIADAKIILSALRSHERMREALAMSVAEMSRARGRLETIATCNEDRRIAAALGSQCDFNRSVFLSQHEREAQ